MILQVKNLSEYDQPITLHTGEAKTVMSGLAIQINTGNDKRLASYYASLMNYNFEVKVIEASGNELNSFQDAVDRLNAIREVATKNQVLQDRKTYPSDRPYEYFSDNNDKPSAPVTLDKIFNNEPISHRSIDKTIVSEVPKVGLSRVEPVTKSPAPTPPVNTVSDGPVVIVDPKIGEVIQDVTPVLPPDYPDDPGALAEEARLAKLEEETLAAQKLSDSKWYKLDELETEELKEVLYTKFEEKTRLRDKSKIIYHIMELADENGVDVFALVDEYLDSKGK